MSNRPSSNLPLILAGTAAAGVAAAAYFFYKNSENSWNNLVPAKSERATVIPFSSFFSVSRDVISGKVGSKQSVQEILSGFESLCECPVSLLLEIADDLEKEMIKGLSKDGEMLKMLPSYVQKLPKGTEEGTFYSLDLGGTNFRVVRVELLGGGKIGKTEFEEVPIPPAMMKCQNDELFDFIAEGLATFIRTNTGSDSAGEEGGNGDREGKRTRELGFTFSFPCKQTAINSGVLIQWTKGFQVAGTEGTDVVMQLEKALQRKDVNMRVAALVNDTVGTLAGARYSFPSAAVGVILGTGTNACYVEKTAEISKLIQDGAGEGEPEMVVNMEWGNFNSSRLPLSFADVILDKESINQAEQIFEKLISGMYLGEVVRIILLRMAEEGGLFGEERGKEYLATSSPLRTKGSLPTPKVSKVDADDSDDLAVVQQVMEKHLQISGLTVDQCHVVKRVCAAVRRRAARLAAAGIFSVLHKSRQFEPSREAPCPGTVAIDGGLFEHYPKFQRDLREAVKELVREVGYDEAARGAVEVELSKDGSGIGAALIAASYTSFNQ